MHIVVLLSLIYVSVFASDSMHSPLPPVCMDSKLHKSEPSQEDHLFQQCSPWKDLSCCTNQTAFVGHSTFHEAYKLNYSHCGNMSQKCMQHFTQNNCFYECSPFLAPWIVKTTSSFRKEKFEGVPICREDCTNWWEDCREEMTCVTNWGKDFEFTSKGNYCPSNTTCRRFSEVYNNATFFCQNVFKGDFVVADNSKPCMKLWFDKGNNTNKQVAQYYYNIIQDNQPPISQSDFSIQPVCMDAKLHKHEPSAEDTLFKQCSPWKDLSCCTNQTAFVGHSTFHEAYKLNYSHCGNMSQKCMQHFTQNNCFYECSPFLAPWIVKTTSSFRKEKFEGVPICRKDCTNWWEDCQDEMTCVTNWGKDFEFTSKGNSCPNNTICRKFSEVYKNATFFCQNNFKGDFVVTDDSKPCMKLWFDEGRNPNKQVAQYYYGKKPNTTAGATKSSTTACTTTTKDTPSVKKERISFPTKSKLGKTGTVVTILFASIFIIITFGCIGYHLYLRFYKVSEQRGPQHCRFLRCLIGGQNTYHRTGSDDHAFIDYGDEVIDDDDDLNPHGTLQMEL